MNSRVAALRKNSLEALPSISVERAKLLTNFYQNENRLVPIPIQRARAFQFLMEHKEISIDDGELIVGERGPKPKETPTYPEICCHTLQDLDILDSREKISYKVNDQTKHVYGNTIIPFWNGKTIRELIFVEMSKEWISAYEAGIFTEFMEQRAPGHTVLDGKIYAMGMLDFKSKIETHLQQLDFLKDPYAYEKQNELKAMAICAQAIIRLGERYSEVAQHLASKETNAARKAELKKIAEICAYVPAHAPRNFWEALQYYWFVHIGVITELNTWDAFNPGRLDQHLLPFYTAGQADGTLTPDIAKELLQCFWIKFNNQPAPPKVGVTAAESGTYTDFATINTGGLKEDGTDGVNDVTYLILDVIKEMRLLQPSSNLQLSKKNPDQFLRKAVEIIKTGYGQPSIFNADVVIQEMVRVGKSIQDARNGGTSGCVETGAFGKENYNLTGYFNLPKVLEVTLNNGVDPINGKQIGIKTGDPCNFLIYQELLDAFTHQLKWFIDVKVKGNNLIERIYAKYLPVPFLSLLIDDCIETGLDYHNGGARYNTSYIQGVGLGTITDSFTALKYHIFDKKTLQMEDFLEIIQSNFMGHEKIRQRLINKTPKYGNDDDYADNVMVDVFETYYASINGRMNTKGGTYHINLLPTTVHVYFGSVIGATPDGRSAWEPLSEGISPVQGADRAGPTAVINSAAKMDHIRTGGTLLNQKFTPQLLSDETGTTKLVHFVRSYFKMDGHHIQFNVVDANTLRDAKLNPEKHRDLIVRVAGYSDYFCDLSEALQDEIITRTEQKVF
jgi:pyruvate formate-lyase/glycerol dehydratase family glycyl radical enzyme